MASVAADRIVGRWEASEDFGTTWRKDFDLIFERRGQVVSRLSKPSLSPGAIPAGTPGKRPMCPAACVGEDGRR